jgi:hypothetical protein
MISMSYAGSCVSNVSGGDLYKARQVRRWHRGCVGLIAIGLILTIGACGLSGAAIQRGAIAPPDVELRTGWVDLFAKNTWPLTCAPISACILTKRPVYMVWVIVRWPASVASSYRLVNIPLESRK